MIFKILLLLVMILLSFLVAYCCLWKPGKWIRIFYGFWIQGAESRMDLKIFTFIHGILSVICFFVFINYFIKYLILIFNHGI